MTEPADAEIDVLVAAYLGDCGPQATQVYSFARAVLSRWGQPAHSGEPVAWLDPWTGAKVTTDYDAYGKHGIPLYTAPQPVEREPLTEDELLAMWTGGDERFMRPVLGKNKVLAFGRAVEHRHGIKGGQHGTE